MCHQRNWAARKVCVVPSQEPISQALHVDVANNWRYRATHRNAIFLVEVFIVHLKICGSQTNFQLFHNSIDLYERPFRQMYHCNGLISPDNNKANECIQRLEICRLQQISELAQIVYGGIWLSGERTQCLTEKTSYYKAREINRTH
jgi:hypothetical protein